ncbi:replication initiation protein [Candidatus Sororendozoicomonas aggregata]|uniref:replication initiation protein n=1 Tax=Candidatus Sororendozoicomonas aggregata TaxID=3073239 RepID=UPI002ED272B7
MKSSNEIDIFDSKHSVITNSKHRMLTESNEFYRVRHSMTVNQQRLLLLVISELQFKHKEEMKAENFIVPSVTLFIPDIEEALEISSKSIYNDLYKATRDLGKISFERRIAPGEYEVIGLIERAKASEGRGLVQIQLTRSALSYFGNLSDNYHKFQLRMIAMLSTPYQMNFYKALCNVTNTQHKTRTFWLYPEYLKKENDLYLPDVIGYDPNSKSYSQYKNIKRRIINDTKDIIGKKTDITDINCKEIKSGRKVIGLKISFRVDYSRRTSLRAASQSWMHPVEYYFSTIHYKKLTPQEQKIYDEHGFKSEDIKKTFNNFVMDYEPIIRQAVIERGDVYPDLSTITWYVNWLLENGAMNKYRTDKPDMMNPEQSYTAVLYASRFQTEDKQLLPSSFEIDDELADWAIAFYPHIDNVKETSKFILWHRENQIKSMNWALKWMQWLAGAESK